MSSRRKQLKPKSFGVGSGDDALVVADANNQAVVEATTTSTDTTATIIISATSHIESESIEAAAIKTAAVDSATLSDVAKETSDPSSSSTNPIETTDHLNIQHGDDNQTTKDKTSEPSESTRQVESSESIEQTETTSQKVNDRTETNTASANTVEPIRINNNSNNQNDELIDEEDEEDDDDEGLLEEGEEGADEEDDDDDDEYMSQIKSCFDSLTSESNGVVYKLNGAATNNKKNRKIQLDSMDYLEINGIGGAMKRKREMISTEEELIDDDLIETDETGADLVNLIDDYDEDDDDCDDYLDDEYSYMNDPSLNQHPNYTNGHMGHSMSSSSISGSVSSANHNKKLKSRYERDENGSYPTNLHNAVMLANPNSHSDMIASMLLMFKCKVCGKGFKHRRSLNRHVKLHSGEKNFKCPHCTTAFARSDHLKAHIRTHNNSKPYKCSVCQCGYSTQAALKVHIAHHHSKSKFKCVLCNNLEFHSQLALEGHIYTKHTKENAELDLDLDDKIKPMSKRNYATHTAANNSSSSSAVVVAAAATANNQHGGNSFTRVKLVDINNYSKDDYHDDLINNGSSSNGNNKSVSSSGSSSSSSNGSETSLENRVITSVGQRRRQDHQHQHGLRRLSKNGKNILCGENDEENLEDLIGDGGGGGSEHHQMDDDLEDEEQEEGEDIEEEDDNLLKELSDAAVAAVATADNDGGGGEDAAIADEVNNLINLNDLDNLNEGDAENRRGGGVDGEEGLDGDLDDDDDDDDLEERLMKKSNCNQQPSSETTTMIDNYGEDDDENDDQMTNSEQQNSIDHNSNKNENKTSADSNNKNTNVPTSKDNETTKNQNVECDEEELDDDIIIEESLNRQAKPVDTSLKTNSHVSRILTSLNETMTRPTPKRIAPKIMPFPSVNQNRTLNGPMSNTLTSRGPTTNSAATSQPSIPPPLLTPANLTRPNSISSNPSPLNKGGSNTGNYVNANYLSSGTLLQQRSTSSSIYSPHQSSNPNTYCEMCNARFSNVESYMAHMRNCHPNVHYQTQRVFEQSSAMSTQHPQPPPAPPMPLQSPQQQQQTTSNAAHQSSANKMPFLTSILSKNPPPTGSSTGITNGTLTKGSTNISQQATSQPPITLTNGGIVIPLVSVNGPPQPPPPPPPPQPSLKSTCNVPNCNCSNSINAAIQTSRSPANPLNRNSLNNDYGESDDYFVIKETQFTCAQCNLTFFKPNDYMNHLKHEHCVEVFRCVLCKQMQLFDNLNLLREHFFEVHQAHKHEFYRCRLCFTSPNSSSSSSNLIFHLVDDLYAHIHRAHPQYAIGPHGVPLAPPPPPQQQQQQHSPGTLSSHLTNRGINHHNMPLRIPVGAMPPPPPPPVQLHPLPPPPPPLPPHHHHQHQHHPHLYSSASSTSHLHPGYTHHVVTGPSYPQPPPPPSITTIQPHHDRYSYLHSTNKFFKCTYCDSDFAQQNSLNQHIQMVHKTMVSQGPSLVNGSPTHHSNSIHYNPSGPTPASLSCQYCRNTFSNRTQLERHMRIHVSSIDLKCNICDKLFDSQEVLSQHKLSHCKTYNNSAPSSSSNTNGLNQSDQVSTKELIKTKQEPLANSSQTQFTYAAAICSFCKQTIENETQFKEHFKRHNNIGVPTPNNQPKPNSFICIVCRQTLSSNNEYNLHMRHHLRRVAAAAAAAAAVVATATSTTATATATTTAATASGSSNRDNSKNDDKSKDNEKTDKSIASSSVSSASNEKETEATKDTSNSGKLRCSKCLVKFEVWQELADHNAEAHGSTTSNPSSNKTSTSNEQQKQPSKSTTQSDSTKIPNGASIKEERKSPALDLTPQIVKPTDESHQKSTQDLNTSESPNRSLSDTPNTLPSPNKSPKQSVQNDLCEICTSKFDSHSKLQSHLLLKHEFVNTNGVLICPVCDESFYRPDTLLSHTYVHGQAAKIYKCDHCSLAFVFKAQLINHSFSHQHQHNQSNTDADVSQASSAIYNLRSHSSSSSSSSQPVAVASTSTATVTAGHLTTLIQQTSNQPRQQQLSSSTSTNYLPIAPHPMGSTINHKRLVSGHQSTNHQVQITTVVPSPIYKSNSNSSFSHTLSNPTATINRPHTRQVIQFNSNLNSNSQMQQRFKCIECNLEFNSFRFFQHHNQSIHGRTIIANHNNNNNNHNGSHSFNNNNYTNNSSHNNINNNNISSNSSSNAGGVKTNSNNNPSSSSSSLSSSLTASALSSSLSSSSSSSIENKNSFTCSSCSKVFSTQRNLDFHSRIHTGYRPYECHICHNKFTRKDNLKGHMQCHLGLRPHACPICNRRFTRKNHVLCHLDVHFKAKSLCCSHCPQEFGSLQILIKHLASVHSINWTNLFDMIKRKFAADKKTKNVDESLGNETTNRGAKRKKRVNKDDSDETSSQSENAEENDYDDEDQYHDEDNYDNEQQPAEVDDSFSEDGNADIDQDQNEIDEIDEGEDQDQQHIKENQIVIERDINPYTTNNNPESNRFWKQTSSSSSSSSLL